jgi:hypothetical protein
MLPGKRVSRAQPRGLNEESETDEKGMKFIAFFLITK